MFHLKTPKGLSKTELYKFLEEQAQALITGELDFIANSANLCSLLWHCLPDINWVGVYRLKPVGLVLGPFQGKPARTRIPLGQGVCALWPKRTGASLVADVEKFPGHIIFATLRHARSWRCRCGFARAGNRRSDLDSPVETGLILWIKRLWRRWQAF